MLLTSVAILRQIPPANAMRLARIRLGICEGAAYHVMSRFVDGAFLFDVKNPACPEAVYFLKLMRKLEAFHGLKVITYSLMSNHFHLLCREPFQKVTEISDKALVEKVRELNGKSTAAELAWQLNHLRL